MKTMKKNRKTQQKRSDTREQDADCCRYVSYCDCCGCYDYALCC